MDGQTKALAQPFVTLTSNAAARIRRLAAEGRAEGGAEGGAKQNRMLRLSVEAGGCSGFSYKFALDQNCDATEDRVFERDGAKLVVDRTSLDLLSGAEIDYIDSIAESAFRVQNPNAASGCGCGTSFSLKS